MIHGDIGMTRARQQRDPQTTLHTSIESRSRPVPGSTLVSLHAGDAHITDIHTHAILALFWKILLKLIGNGQKPRRRQQSSTRNQVKVGAGSFRNTFLPSLRQRAQSQIYRFLVARQTRKDVKKQKIHNRNNLLAGLGRTRGQRGQTNNNVSGPAKHNMAYFAQGSAEPGSRRKRLAGYLKAANDARQSYVQSYFGAEDAGDNRIDLDGGPGAFPDAAVVRNGNEEMILFPSYARRHVQHKVSAMCEQSARYSGRHSLADNISPIVRTVLAVR